MDTFEKYKRRLGQIERAAHRMWVVYVRTDEKYHPLCDVHGQAIAYTCRNDARASLYNERALRGKGHAYLQKVGPIS